MSGAAPRRDVVAELSALPPALRVLAYRALPLRLRAELKERWAIRAHDGQFEPEGDWRIWLIRAGRGFGKTRAGAEWVSALARRMKAEMEAGFAGAGNAGRPMLREGGLKWQALSLTPADMDFAGTKAAAAREIALAFGVPPMLLGLPGDNTYANYKEANRALWRLAILPLADAILSALAQGLRPWFAEAALGVDLDRVPALADERAALWAQVAGADFLDAGEKRAMVGLGAPSALLGAEIEADHRTDQPDHGGEDG